MALSKRWRWALPIALVLLFILWNPVGYGGASGSDDHRYLTAARCWLNGAPCLPTNHWEGRWPLVGPLAASIDALGINRLALALPSLLASLACLILLKWLGDRLFERPIGLASALIYGLVPAFAIQAYSATVEPIELAFILGCFALLTLERPILAGLCLGIAFQTRETAVAAIVPAMVLLWKDRGSLFRFLAAFAAPLLAEFLFYYLTTGHALYRRTLSMEHTLIPSTELRRIDRGSPFFNWNIIAEWKHEPGLRVHWLVDGFLNLLVNLKTGLLFTLAPLFAVLYRGRLDRRETKLVWFLIGSSFFYAAVLIYALSIDPKPRMMYVPLAGLGLALGLIAVRAWNLVIAATFVTVVPLMGIALAAQPRHLDWEKAGERINARYRGQIESSQAGYFGMHPELRDLPTTGSGKPYLLFIRNQPCRLPSNMDPFDVSQMAVVAEERGNPIAVAFDYEWRLCLYRYPEGFQPPVIPRAEQQFPRRV